MELKLFPKYVIGKVKDILIYNYQKFEAPLQFDVLNLTGHVMYSLCVLSDEKPYVKIPKPQLRGVYLIRITWGHHVFVQRVLFI